MCILCCECLVTCGVVSFVVSLFQAAFCPSGKERDRWRARGGRGGSFKMPSRRTTSSNPTPASSSPPPPPPPPRPPLRSRRKSKSPLSRSNRAASKLALDLDQIEAISDPVDTRHIGGGSRDRRGFKESELDRNWESVALELHCRGSRMRSAVYQTSDLPSMVKAKRQLDQREVIGRIDRSKLKATFV